MGRVFIESSANQLVAELVIRYANRQGHHLDLRTPSFTPCDFGLLKINEYVFYPNTEIYRQIKKNNFEFPLVLVESFWPGGG